MIHKFDKLKKFKYFHQTNYTSNKIKKQFFSLIMLKLILFISLILSSTQIINQHNLLRSTNENTLTSFINILAIGHLVESAAKRLSFYHEYKDLMIKLENLSDLCLGLEFQYENILRSDKSFKTRIKELCTVVNDIESLRNSLSKADSNLVDDLVKKIFDWIESFNLHLSDENLNDLLGSFFTLKD